MFSFFQNLKDFNTHDDLALQVVKRFVIYHKHFVIYHKHFIIYHKHLSAAFPEWWKTALWIITNSVI